VRTSDPKCITILISTHRNELHTFQSTSDDDNIIPTIPGCEHNSRAKTNFKISGQSVEKRIKVSRDNSGWAPIRNTAPEAHSSPQSSSLHTQTRLYYQHHSLTVEAVGETVAPQVPDTVLSSEPAGSHTGTSVDPFTSPCV
jgi:hypothetical protein